MTTQEREFPFTRDDFQFLAGLAQARTGIVLAEQKKDMVYGRLARRLRALKLQSFREYCNILQSPAGADEMSHLVNAITTNLTSFFRENHHFEHLRDFLGGIAKNNPGGGKLRIWSAGCSSGMEPYSIAMTMREAIPALHKWDARILATDIDSNMLATGQRGEYAAADTDNISAAYKKFVQPTASPDRVTMAEDLRQMIAFKQLNLLEDWPMKGPFDAIFCRNVAIYFDKETKKRIFEKYASLLKPDGWLYIGHSENLHGITSLFTLAGRTMYRRTA